MRCLARTSTKINSGLHTLDDGVTMSSADYPSVLLAKSQHSKGMPIAAATIWAAMKPTALLGSMPAKLFDIVRAIVTAGLAKLVDDVNQ
jgi:hypothetical protein